MELPKNEATFEIDVVGADTYKEYKGLFTCRCVLNVGQKHGMALEESRLLGSYVNPTKELSGLAVVLSTLRAKIVEAPDWWKQSLGGAMIQDENVLIVLYDKLDEVEKEWRQKVKELANPSVDLSSQNP